MSDVHADELIRVAEDDIASAKTLLSTTPPLLATAAYHAEQGAEKAVKAALTKLGLEYHKSHDIGALVQMLPADHSFVNLAARLVVTTPWAIEFRYSIATPPSADEIARALDNALDLTAAVAKTLAPPTMEFTIRLAAASPNEWRCQRIVGIWVEPRLVEGAVAAPADVDPPAVLALRVIGETCVHQPEYDLADPKFPPTGRTLYGWAGIHHAYDLMLSKRESPTKAHLYLNAVRLDEAVQANPELLPGFAALLEDHLQGEPPQRL